MKKLLTLIAGLAVVVGVGMSILAPTPAFADCSTVTGAANIAACSACEAQSGSTWSDGKCGGDNNTDLNSTIHTVINIMLFVIGILAVIMIIYGGIRYTISRGSEKEVEGAKNTIMYSIVGLVVAILAFAIVQWVFSSLSGGASN